MKQFCRLLAVAIFLYVESSFALQKENDGQSLSGIIKGPMVACIDKKDYDQVFRFMFIEKDYDAASELTQFGRCVLLGDREKVTVQDVGFSKIQIRRRGSAKLYWISREFVE